jgi:DNA-directed RNA polymerase subunit M/transcription elongation factor TFIIS
MNWNLFNKLTLDDKTRKKPFVNDVVLLQPPPPKKSIFTVTWYTCDKCNRKESVAETVQSRRADEGFSTHVRCVCGNKFVING